ncbi:delta-lactam-biosynthetic de-N-acetylase [Haloplasma contractile]|uniref:Polysaccharide deacetylase PdaA protein n=1 Tax=Haloplasma contractile SSD-17B TaxID=1033810 RepID=U2EDH3_9MOLU|nr:delta-lactam-biosynthetic de-N-acetylase [Haloplasma contractile]ERJ13028.1 putative polysaccharide deacetylase PdaA protein [Haloplasma contractile SSD-17B]
MIKKVGVFKRLLIVIGTIGFLLTTSYYITEVQANAGYGWGFKPNDNHKQPEVGIYKDILERHNAYYVGNSHRKEIYLTFDAGYENGFTDDILDVLKQHDVPATFFVTGTYMKNNPNLIKRMVNEHHTVGNHTFTHPDMTAIDITQYKKELKRVEDEFYKLTNQDMMKIMRPPRGRFSDRSLKIADDLGYHNIFWSLAFKDWETKNQHGWQYAYNSVMNRIHPGAVILLHTVSEDNAKALSHIISDLREEGYDFVPIKNLLTQKVPLVE